MPTENSETEHASFCEFGSITEIICSISLCFLPELCSSIEQLAELEDKNGTVVSRTARKFFRRTSLFYFISKQWCMHNNYLSIITALRVEFHRKKNKHPIFDDSESPSRPVVMIFFVAVSVTWVFYGTGLFALCPNP